MKTMKKIVTAVLLFGIDGLMMFLFQKFPSFFFPAYRTFSKKWIAFLSSLSGGLKIAVWDIGALVLAVLAIVSLIYVLVKRKSFFKWFQNVVLLVSLLAFVAVQGWMLNHYAPKLSEDLNLEVKEYSVDELYACSEYYMLKAAEYADKIERKDGVALYQDFYEMAEIAGASYEELAGTYPVFEGTAVPVKKLSVIGEYLMYNGIVGMFMPITGEAGVPGSVPVVPLGFTMCHEAGHRLGLAGEEEANFAAFLACIYNKDVRFLYSGYYNAFSYCFSALYRADSERAKSLLESHQDDPGVKLLLKDRQDTSEYYRKYDSPLQEVSDQINDTYLKTFSQKEGIRSYGMVVDYMIAWHLKNLD